MSWCQHSWPHPGKSYSGARYGSAYEGDELRVLCELERGAPFCVLASNIGASREQCSYARQMVTHAGDVERGIAEEVLLIDVRPDLNQSEHSIFLAERGGESERGRSHPRLLKANVGSGINQRLDARRIDWFVAVREAAREHEWCEPPRVKQIYFGPGREDELDKCGVPTHSSISKSGAALAVCARSDTRPIFEELAHLLLIHAMN